MKKLFAIALISSLLAGCIVVPEYGGGAPFCPPGQAKKGRC